MRNGADGGEMLNDLRAAAVGDPGRVRHDIPPPPVRASARGRLQDDAAGPRRRWASRRLEAATRIMVGGGQQGPGDRRRLHAVQHATRRRVYADIDREKAREAGA